MTPRSQSADARLEKQTYVHALRLKNSARDERVAGGGLLGFGRPAAAGNQDACFVCIPMASETCGKPSVVALTRNALDTIHSGSSASVVTGLAC